ncbi:unnamed protein product, partial [Rotaria sp. Silwood2]
MNLFYPTTKWQQINLWLKTLSHIIDPSINDYAFLIREKNIMINDNQTILSTIDQTTSMTIDIINRNTIIEVTFTYETNNQSIFALKSMKISSLLNLIDFYSDDCVLMMKGINEQILTEDDLQK